MTVYALSHPYDLTFSRVAGITRICAARPYELREKKKEKGGRAEGGRVKHEKISWGIRYPWMIIIKRRHLLFAWTPRAFFHERDIKRERLVRA